MTPSRQRPRLAVAFAVVLALLCPQTAAATEILFAVLIPDALQFQLYTPLVNADGLGYLGYTAPFFRVNNGQKAELLGAARIILWNRTVPDPFFAPFGPLAGLAVLDFGTFQAHLGLIQTPSKLLTTIGLRGPSSVFVTAAGAWAIADGSFVTGGDSNDLVIGGLLRIDDLPSNLGVQALELDLRFAVPVFHSDITPTEEHVVGASGDQLGSFYGQTLLGGTARPVRAYNSFDSQMTGLGRRAHLLAIHNGGDDYLLVACSGLEATASMACTVSGTGPITSALSGGGVYIPQDISTLLQFQAFLVLP